MLSLARHMQQHHAAGALGLTIIAGPPISKVYIVDPKALNKSMLNVFLFIKNYYYSYEKIGTKLHTIGL